MTTEPIPCAARTAAFTQLVRENPLKCEVAFGDVVEQCAYVERIKDSAWHRVRRPSGVVVQVHENQIEEKFRNWLRINVFPYGRYETPQHKETP